MEYKSLNLGIRPNFLDLAKGFGIFIVVFWHYVWYLDIPFQNNLLWNIEFNISLFHMPLFFIIAGMLYKIRPIKEEIKKDVNSLLAPYLLISVLCLIVSIIMKDVSIKQFVLHITGILSGHDFFVTTPVVYAALWFVYSLFFIKIVVSFIYNCRKPISLLFIVLSILTALVTIMKGNVFPFRIDTSSIGLLFFIIGFKGKHLIERIMQKTKHLLFTAAISLIIITISALYNINYDEFRGYVSIYACLWGKSFIVYVIGGISGTLLLFSLCSLILRLKFRNNILVNISMNISNGTIIILGFHGLFYPFFKGILVSSNFFTAVGFSLFILFICYWLIILSSKFFPILLGGRKLKT